MLSGHFFLPIFLCQSCALPDQVKISIETTRTEGLKYRIYVTLATLPCFRRPCRTLAQSSFRRQVLNALLSLRFVSSVIALSQNMLALPILEGFNCSQTLHFTIRLCPLKLRNGIKRDACSSTLLFLFNIVEQFPSIDIFPN
jgi:hypothetical protein